MDLHLLSNGVGVKTVTTGVGVVTIAVAALFLMVTVAVLIPEATYGFCSTSLTENCLSCSFAEFSNILMKAHSF